MWLWFLHLGFWCDGINGTHEDVCYDEDCHKAVREVDATEVQIIKALAIFVHQYHQECDDLWQGATCSRERENRELSEAKPAKSPRWISGGSTQPEDNKDFYGWKINQLMPKTIVMSNLWAWVCWSTPPKGVSLVDIVDITDVGEVPFPATGGGRHHWKFRSIVRGLLGSHGHWRKSAKVWEVVKGFICFIAVIK